MSPIMRRSAFEASPALRLGCSDGWLSAVQHCSCFGCSGPLTALAAPTKAYTVTMLLGRLTVAVADSATAGCVAARVGGPQGTWWLGLLLLACSTPVHLISVWTDYPLWYHLEYLLPLIPVIGLAG